MIGDAGDDVGMTTEVGHTKRCERYADAIPAKSRLFEECVDESAFAECSVDGEIAVDARHARQILPFSQRDQRCIGKVGRHVAILVEKSGDPGQVGGRGLIDVERPVSPQQKVALCPHRKTQEECRLSEDRHVGDEARPACADELDRSDVMPVIPIEQRDQRPGVNENAWHEAARRE